MKRYLGWAAIIPAFWLCHCKAKLSYTQKGGILSGGGTQSQEGGTNSGIEESGKETTNASQPETSQALQGVGQLNASFSLTKLFVSWDPPANASSIPVSSYEVSVSPGNTTMTVTDTHAIIPSISQGTDYTVSVRAISQNQAATPIESIMIKPLDILVRPGYGAIGLSWMPSTGATDYWIYRETTPNFVPSVPFMKTKYTETIDEAAANGVTYYYKVEAYAGASLLGITAESVGVASANIPAPVSQLAAETAEEAAVTVRWVAPTQGAAVSKYWIYRSTSPTFVTSPELPLAEVSASTTSYTDTQLVNGTTYYYRVLAVGAGGVSHDSATAWARPWLHAAPASNTNLFVAAGASGDGSYASPYGSITTAIAQAAAGAVITVLDGTYTISSAIIIDKSLKLRSRKGSYLYDTAVIDTNTVNLAAAVKINAGLDGVEVIGLTFKGFNATSASSEGTIHILDSRTSDNIYIVNNWIYNIPASTTGAPGIRASNAVSSLHGEDWQIIGNRLENLMSASGSCIRAYYISYATIADNILAKCNYSGIQLEDGQGQRVVRNTISDVGKAAIAIGLTSASNPTAFVVMAHNVIIRASRDLTTSATDYGGIRFYDVLAGHQMLIANNDISDSVKGVVIKSSATLTGLLTVTHNNLHGNSAYGLHNQSTTNGANVSAEHNYWGCASGPVVQGVSSGGCDGVGWANGSVDYLPFLTASPL